MHIITRHFFVLAIAFVDCATTESIGAVIERDWKSSGDGLLTYDEVSRREWLDLSVSDTTVYFGSREMQYQAVIDQTAPGGALAGFKPAN